MAKYRKKPVVIEAVQFTVDSYEEAEALAPGKVTAIGNRIDGVWTPICLYVETLEGRMSALPGDWIVRGVQGEVYPVKPDIFAETYEEAE